MATCRRGRFAVIFLNWLDGAVASIFRSFGHLIDSVRLFFQRFLRSSLNCCLAADLLMGNCPLIALGRSLSSLDLPCAASFASSSLRSFPSISTCPGTHRSVGIARPSRSNSSVMVLCIVSTRYDPGVLRVSVVDRIAAILSSAMDVDWDGVSCLMSCNARCMPVSSASYTVCWFARPRCLCITDTSRPFLYSTAAAPTPPSISEPSEYTWISSLLACSSSMAASLFGAILVGILDSHLGLNRIVWISSYISG